MSSKYRFSPNAATGFLSDEDTKKYFSRLGFSVVGFLLVATLSSSAISLLYGEIAKKIYPALTSNSTYWSVALNIISMISIYAIGLPIFLAILKPLPRITPFKAKMKFSSWLGGFCVALLFLSVGSYISNVILFSIESMLNITTSNPIQEMISSNSIWTTLIFTVILAPILEELLFRKLICDRLLPLGEGYAIFVSAAIFGLIHGNFYQFAYAFLLGAFFSFIYVKTGKLLYSTIYHILINFIGSVVSIWIVGLIDMDALNKILESGAIDMTDPATAALMRSMYILLAYEAVMLAAYIVGLVLLFKARKKNMITLEAGILPPPKQHRFSNIFLTTGVAAAIAVSVFTFVLSLL